MSTDGFSSLPKKITKVVVLGSSLALLATSAACGSSSTSTPSTPSTGTTGTPSPTTTADIGAIPCTNLHTGYDGDDRCIEPPPAGKGFQFHYGPSDYKDAAEVAKYTLPAHQEVTDCVNFPTPNDTEVYFNEYHSRMRPGCRRGNTTDCSPPPNSSMHQVIICDNDDSGMRSVVGWSARIAVRRPSGKSIRRRCAIADAR